MKLRSKRRLAPTTGVDSVAGKRERSRAGWVLEYLGKTFGPEVKLLPGTTAAKTAKIELTAPVVCLSSSTVSEAERAGNESEESKLRSQPSTG